MGFFDDYTYVKDDRPHIGPGNHRCMIRSVEERKSSSGNDMLVIKVRISGTPIDINYHLVRNEFMARNLSRLYDAFPSINRSTDILQWVGAEGACRLKWDERDDRYLAIAYWLTPDSARQLPPFAWIDKQESEDDSYRGEYTDADCPFDYNQEPQILYGGYPVR